MRDLVEYEWFEASGLAVLTYEDEKGALSIDSLSQPMPTPKPDREKYNTELKHWLKTQS